MENSLQENTSNVTNTTNENAGIDVASQGRTFDPSTYMGSLETFFVIVQNEYAREQDKKRSFETRCGFILAALIVIFPMIAEQMKIGNFFVFRSRDFLVTTTVFVFFKVLVCILCLMSLICSLFFSSYILFIFRYSAFNTDSITSETLGHQKNIELGKVIIAYRDIIKNMRKINEKIAKSLGRAIFSMSLCFGFAFLYIIF